MSERERLVELLLESGPIKERDLDDGWGDNEISDIAEYLLENGVIVLSVKVGQTVYHFGYSFIIKKIEMLQDEIIYRCGNLGTDDYMAFCESDIGKTVFLTKEEAEKALKGGAE